MYVLSYANILEQDHRYKLRDSEINEKVAIGKVYKITYSVAV